RRRRATLDGLKETSPIGHRLQPDRAEKPIRDAVKTALPTDDAPTISAAVCAFLQTRADYAAWRRASHLQDADRRLRAAVSRLVPRGAGTRRAFVYGRLMPSSFGRSGAGRDHRGSGATCYLFGACNELRLACWPG